MFVFLLPNLLDFFYGMQLILNFVIIFVLVSLQHFDSVIGRSDDVLGINQRFDCLEIGVLARPLDNRIVFDVLTILHLEYYSNRHNKNTNQISLPPNKPPKSLHNPLLPKNK